MLAGPLLSYTVIRALTRRLTAQGGGPTSLTGLAPRVQAIPVLHKEIRMRLFLGVCLAGLVALAGFQSPANAKGKGAKQVPPVLNFKMESLDGKEVDLAKYQGKVILMVNVASQCGYTPQYKGLQALHEKYAKQGLVVLGFPSNDFGKQEPGTSEEIADFCKKNYGVTFDMFAKVKVKGEDKCPLYEFLTSKKTDPKFAGEVKWNFQKYLIGRGGEIVGRFGSAVKPESQELNKAIKGELAK
jgi:glutathione peroxidase